MLDENISTPIYVECDKMYKVVFKNSGILCLALIFNLRNPARKKRCSRLQDTTRHILFFQ